MRSLTKTGKLIAIIIVLSVVLSPLLWIFSTSFKDFKSIMVGKIFLFQPTLDNYTYLLAQEDFLQMLLNSTVVALSTTIIAVIVGSLGAYEIVRYRLIGNLNTFILIWLLLIRMIFPITLAIPLYDLLRGYNLIDTRTV